MNAPAPLEGITTQMVETSRLKMHTYFSGPADGIPVIFLHGNFSSALFWQTTMRDLPAGFRGIAPDLRGYGWTEFQPVDARRGYRDWMEDLLALMDALQLPRAHLVGWSLGGGILYRLMADHPERALSITLVCPVSPFGFGGTKDETGTPCFPDFAGSGGGVVNPEFIRRITEGDRTAEDPNSPRNVMAGFYYKPGFKAEMEEDFLTGALREVTGPQNYPGDASPSVNWPMTAPGVWGVINAGAPKYVLGDLADMEKAPLKLPVLWLRGDADMIVSDNSMFDLGALGKLGYVPGWPGDEIYPPQPMVTQTRYGLNRYAAAGGKYEEVVIADAAHSPHIEKSEVVNAAFHTFLKNHS